MYRTKARHAQGPMLEELNAMWQTAHDMCSLSAYHAAFADCKEGEVYDPSKPHFYSYHTGQTSMARSLSPQILCGNLLV
jgi:hypothetical protein